MGPMQHKPAASPTTTMQVDQRLAAASRWSAEKLGLEDVAPLPVSGDASDLTPGDRMRGGLRQQQDGQDRKQECQQEASHHPGIISDSNTNVVRRPICRQERHNHVARGLLAPAKVS